jgi:DNA-binding CsgD family transcriptional regulator
MASEIARRARRAHEERAWQRAFDLFAAADAEYPLEVADVERFAECAALTGRDARFIELLERCYEAHLAAGSNLDAARAAFWAGFRSLGLGELGRGTAWLGRCQRLVEEAEQDHVLSGYLELPLAFRQLMRGNTDEALAIAIRITRCGERFGDRDLCSLGRTLQGRALLQEGDMDAGLAQLDESVLPAVSGALSPLVAGIVYCAVIAQCQRYYALDRAREWTAALTAFCDAQPELVTFRGSCLVHRSQVSQLEGRWEQALQQASNASANALAQAEPEMAADAHYQQAEIHRLRGEFEAAEAAFSKAQQLGRDVQPGLALLRLRRGQTTAAESGLSRALSEVSDPFARAKLLVGAVEFYLARSDLEHARQLVSELEQLAERFSNDCLHAFSAHARGRWQLAGGDARAALGPLRRAFFIWQRIGAPYYEALVQADLATACDALGDREGSQGARDTARKTFELLGAKPDLEALSSTPAKAGFGLTPRELQVLRLVAAGMTNKEAAVQLGLSERTVDRHVANIFRKLDVTTRAAATAAALKHALV